jgi:hypothetical protein
MITNFQNMPKNNMGNQNVQSTWFQIKWLNSAETCSVEFYQSGVNVGD